MLYDLLKIPATIGFRLYCRHLRCNNKAALSYDGPLLIACNHPNSFLDAIVIASVFKRPVYSLARGDAFKKPFFAKLLRSLNMYPVYRTSEGVENMEHNYSTFDSCKELFKKNGIVLIFSEGRCINEWHLRPLKKGTARLALSSWADGIDLKVLPTGLNYQGFHSYDKNIHLLLGDIISSKDIDQSNGFGRSVLSFNRLLRQSLEPLVYEIGEKDLAARKQLFETPVPVWKKIGLFIPALAGALLHFPLHATAAFFAKKYGSNNDHHDSIIIAILFIFYPLYLLLFTCIAIAVSGSWYGLLTILLMPFLAWSYLQVKKQL